MTIKLQLCEISLFELIYNELNLGKNLVKYDKQVINIDNLPDKLQIQKFLFFKEYLAYTVIKSVVLSREL